MPYTIVIARFADVAKNLFAGKRDAQHIPALPKSAEAALVWALAKHHNAPIVWIADSPHALELMHRDLVTLSPADGPPPLFHPPATLPLPADKKPDPDLAGHRLATLLALSSSTPSAVVLATCIQSLMQKTTSPSTLRQHTLSLAVGSDLGPESVVEHLSGTGYAFEVEIQEKGQVSLRGGILDCWPPTEPQPIRIEFTGSVIESIRAFDPADQKSVRKLQAATLPPALEEVSDADTLLSHLPDTALFAWSDPESIRTHAAIFEEGLLESHSRKRAVTFAELHDLISRRPAGGRLDIGDTADAGAPAGFPEIRHLPRVFSLPGGDFQPDLSEQARKRLLDSLCERAENGQDVVIAFDTPGMLDHFKAASGQHLPRRIRLCMGALSEGFACDALNLVVVSEADLYGIRKIQTRRYEPPGHRAAAPAAGERITELADLQPGDLVVHVDHGIGRYMGLTEITFDGQRQETVTIEYADKARLHVPVTQIHLLSRYVGVRRHSVPLHSLGGKRWVREKAAAEQAVTDLAATLIETQAQRRVLEGHAFAPDKPWQVEFEASFPYEETPDQVTVIRDVKKDMEVPRPMDRLVCGDAGYGKTEVAMRAAFKAVMDARQVAVLVPTTVLAQQHFQTFTERMAPFPIRVEMLSRFCSLSRHNAIIRDLAEGAVDIVIGTHALVQPGIKFKNLGLVIVDEEQRFGVLHKERLKQIRRLVDVLTLTATPIPRTLYLSMTGARDMSLLQTPPRERTAIETVVAKNHDDVIREAILREVNRGGQVFYLHNRILTIETVRKRLLQVAPEARIEVAHGQMASAELSSVMKRFAAGEFDVLLCTTIIESGLDIPRANTILIDRSDRFGIADLYQLRGRVGRSSHRAYAYLLIPSHGHIESDARKRIQAVKRFSGTGAGFNIALRDLEIRGAGNLLGAEQSGHISAVGFGLYCQMLRRTIARLQGKEPPPVIDVELSLDFIGMSGASLSPEHSAVIPYDYIEDEPIRIGIYRKMAEVSRRAEVDSLRNELQDRFGRVPPPVNRLLKLAELRIVCADRDIRKVEVRDRKLVLVSRKGDLHQVDRHFPRLAATLPDALLDEIISHVRRLPASGVSP